MGPSCPAFGAVLLGDVVAASAVEPTELDAMPAIADTTRPSKSCATAAAVHSVSCHVAASPAFTVAASELTMRSVAAAVATPFGASFAAAATFGTTVRLWMAASASVCTTSTFAALAFACAPRLHVHQSM